MPDYDEEINKIVFRLQNLADAFFPCFKQNPRKCVCLRYSLKKHRNKKRNKLLVNMRTSSNLRTLERMRKNSKVI